MTSTVTDEKEYHNMRESGGVFFFKVDTRINSEFFCKNEVSLKSKYLYNVFTMCL